MTRKPGKRRPAGAPARSAAPPQTGLFPGEGFELTGAVERIRFRAEDTGYTVLLLQPDNPDSPRVAVVGHLSSIREGERVRFEGRWKEHPRFGRQFHAERASPLPPTTVEGIEKYLASGIVKNIGPALARRIVARFGERALDVLDAHPERLKEVPGLGEKKLAAIVESWKSQSEVREIMLFLQQYDVPLHLSEKILRTYGEASARILREDPYRLAADIHGVGFKSADRIARNLGIPADSPKRLAAGAIYALNQLAEREGHCFSPYADLVETAADMLETPPEALAPVLDGMGRDGALVIESASRAENVASTAHRRVYARPLHAAECEVARRLAAILNAPRDAARLEAALRGQGAPGGTIPERLGHLARRAIEGGMATKDQGAAIEGALTRKALVVTGGPGTGKTTIVSAVAGLYSKLGLEVILGAPTGRAAKRLSEVTGHEAATIHRLLEFKWHAGGFTRDAENPLTGDVVIIDEASMLDVHLTAHLLRAVPDEATLVMVGDVDQLPSVGPGNVLRDVIDSETLPVARLTEVFRQARASLIVENAHRVNRGEMPRSGKGEREDAPLDYYFIEEAEAERCADLVIELCRARIPEKFGVDPIAELQVISPMQRGALGVQSLNARLQEALNPAGGARALQSGGRTFRAGDKLIQARNNYEKEVFNGDIGVVRSVSPEAGSVRVAFDSGVVEYARSALDEVTHAYAITVHKSQGSEYPAVVIPLHTQHYPMLQRNLVYTALTRAKRLAVLVGAKKALGMAVGNASVRRRWSGLPERIRREANLAPLPEDEASPRPEAGSAAGEEARTTEEAPPDALYDEEAGEETAGGEDDAPPAGELTYHPVEE